MEAVLDTNVFLRGKSVPDFDGYLTVPAVKQEIRSDRGISKLEVTDVKFYEPSENAMEKVSLKAEDIGSQVSSTDMKLVALALEKDSVLVTDDRDMQNLCSHLEVKFQGFMDEAIGQERVWVKKCSNCGETVDEEACKNCGSTDTVRKPARNS